MLMVAHYWQSCIDPVLLSTLIVPHICVAHSRQFTGGFLRRVSRRAGAVNDNVRGSIGQDCRRESRKIIGRQVNRTGQMIVMIGGGGQSFDE